MSYWILLLGFLTSGVTALVLTSMEQLSADFLHFVPRLFTAVVVLVAGFMLANFAWRATLLAAVNAHLQSARVVSGGVRFLVSLLALAMALEQLGLAQHVVVTAFAIAFGGVILGPSISFGIGGGGIAKRLLGRRFPDDPLPRQGDVSHL